MRSKYNAWMIMCNLLFVCDAQNSNPVEIVLNHLTHKRQIQSTGCILPPHPDHGRWKLLNGEARPGDKALPSSVIIFECNHGYKLSSKFPAVCLEDWSSPIPECEELCPPLYPSNTYDMICTNKVGKEVNCSEASHGTNLDYTCKTYYETPFGYKNTLFCENGKWDHPKPVCQPVCGKKIYNDTKVLIYGVEPDKIILHPWVAAIYKKKSYSYENICGGSILSQTVILTAAHCVTNDYGDVLPKENYIVGVGKLYRSYQAPEDKEAQYLQLSQIFVPEEYKGDIRKYSADIAVLVVKKEIILKKVVQPVCFLNMKNIRLRVGNKGEVSGWGFAEGNVRSETLRSLVIPYKYETICADELPPYWADMYYLKDKICAGFYNKSIAVCKGDSGGGLAFKYRENNRYYIHGIVSLSEQVDYTCNIQQNALYTSVASHYEFVDHLLTKYAPKIKDCVLPLHPQNGKWTIEEGIWKPGDFVTSDTILKVECNEGFILSSSRIVECSTAYNLPTCEMPCPPLKLPYGGYSRCLNRKSQRIECSTAIDGSSMWYFCPRKYTEAGDFNRTCLKGSWGLPAPECIPDCGKRAVGSDTGSGYLWSVGIYKINKADREKYQYVCGGSLVSEYVVVTAAQCVTDESGHLLSKDDYLVAAGRGYRTFNGSVDKGTQISNITYIIVNPIYKITKDIHNIAMLVISLRFTLNHFVQPVCIIKGSDNWWKRGQKATMVGRRLEEGDSSEKEDSIDVINLVEYDCMYPPQFDSNSFVLGNICIGFTNESTCLLPEDNGKGIVIRHPKTDRYYLFAIVTYYENLGCQKNFWNIKVSKYSDPIYYTATYL